MYNVKLNDTNYNPKSGWRIKKDKLLELYDQNRIHFPKKKEAIYIKKYILEENLVNFVLI